MVALCRYSIQFYTHLFGSKPYWTNQLLLLSIICRIIIQANVHLLANKPYHTQWDFWVRTHTIALLTGSDCGKVQRKFQVALKAYWPGKQWLFSLWKYKGQQSFRYYFIIYTPPFLSWEPSAANKNATLKTKLELQCKILVPQYSPRTPQVWPPLQTAKSQLAGVGESHTHES